MTYNIPDSIKEESARKLHEALCAEYLRVHGVEDIPDSSLALIGDVASMEQIKQRLAEEIASRPVVKVRNGRQEYEKPNPAISELSRLASAQRRNLAELKLTPASRKGIADLPQDDDFSEF